MKHIFTFLLALCTCAYASAATIPVAPGENHIAEAFVSAQAGDVLELSTGNYYEWSTITINKAITFKAAEGNAPVVKFNVLSITNDFEANGLTIENLSNSNYLLRTDGNVAGTITIKNCTLSNQAPTPFIYLSSNSVENLVIENCVFTGTTKNQGGIVYAGSSSNVIGQFTMTNSTAYNVAGELAVWLGAVTNAYVDHCTFYNCGTRPVYLAGTLTTCEVKNCAVVAPEVASAYCIATYGGTVENCLYYNLSAPRSSGVTVTGCINANPLFIDAANADFSFTYASPLYKGATDGTNIGDPRWSMKLLNEVDVPATLNLSNVEAYTTPLYNTDYFDLGPNNSSADLNLFAIWTVNVTPGQYNVSAVAESTNGFTLVLDLIDIETGMVVKTISGGNKKTDLGAWNLTDVEAGKYLLKLRNTTGWSAVKVQSITLAYAGGATVAIPGTLMAADAMFSAEGTRADGQISFPASTIQNDEIIFKVHAENAIVNSDVSITISTTNGHNYLVAFYDNTNTLVASVSEDGQHSTNGTFSLGKVSLPAGDYTVKIINQTQWSEAKFESLAIIYNGGATIALPGTILAADALYSARGSREGEYIVFPADGSLPNDYITMYASVAEAGTYQFTLHCSTTDYHQYKAIIRDRATHALIDEVGRAYGNNTADVVLGTANLPVGEIEIELHQTNAWGHAKFASIDVAKVSDAQHVYTLTVSEAGFSTLVVPFDAISISSGAEVYDLTVSGDEIIATEATGIYAGKPVLVKAPAGDYNVRSAYGAVKDFSGDLVNGALHGTYTTMEAPLSEGGEYSYVLQNQGGVVAFYQLLESSNKTINPYRAYLRAAYNASAASGAPMRIRFGAQTPTDIEALQTVTLEEALCRGEVYDLMGRRVGAISGQGVYIIAGQKLYIH